MLFAALSNAACLHNAFFLFLPLMFANAVCFHVLSWFIDTYFNLSHVLFRNMHSAFICWFFIILCSHCFCSSYMLSGDMTHK